MGSKLGKWWGK